MLKDAYGNEIKVGDEVRALVPAWPPLNSKLKGKGPPGSGHAFYGCAVVKQVKAAVVTLGHATSPSHIPVELGAKVVVESACDGREIKTVA